MAPSPADVPIGAQVEVTAGIGHVRFCGSTSFSAGKWVGVELSAPNGKNNGTVNGVRYFDCPPLHGVFVRPSQAKIIKQLAPSPPSAPGSSRPSEKPLSRSSSFRSSPTGSSRAPSPPKPSTSNYAPHVPTRMGLPSTPAKTAAKVSIAIPQPSRLMQPRRSTNRESVDLTSSPLQLSFSTNASPPTPPTPPSVVRRQSIQPSAPSQTQWSRTQPPPPPPPQIQLRAPDTTPPEPVSPILDIPIQAEPEPIAPQPATQAQDDSQELRAKLRVLEAKRADDAKRIRELENRLTEAEAFMSLRPKLQAKLQSLQSENLAFKREVADLKLEQETFEARLLEQSEQLEMVMLDKEMAEERAEAAEAELELQNEKHAEKEVELEVLQQEKAQRKEGVDGDPSAKSSLDYIQLEKQNERLKEALIRLRDLTHESEAEQRHKIADLERELQATDEMQSQFEQTLSRLEIAENQIDDLKAQLDDALGAEDMLVQLTERNLLMGEKMEEMRAAIEDLEALKELSDEIEETHVETEKALQEEIDEKDMRLITHVRAIEALQDAVADYENTISQFRELVTNLQNELETARELSQTHQNESQTQANQAAAALTLNMKLQSTASKNQAKTIDLEIKRLDAAQAREMLSIVQPYLPQAYLDSDRDATSCYMLFQRLSYKTDLINTLVGQSYNMPESLFGEVSDSSLVGVCEMRGIAAHVSTLCKRFAAVLRRCDGEFYINIGKLLPEVAPMEKRLDMHIDTLRREEFRFLECGSDVQKMLGQFDHLAETYFSDFQFDLGERELDRILSVEHDLDSFVAAIGVTKSELEATMKDDEIEVAYEDLDIRSQVFTPMNNVLEASRSARAAIRKIAKRVEDLLNESAALREDALLQLSPLAEIATKASNFGIQLGQRVNKYISDIRTSKSPFELSTILTAVREISAATIAAKDASSWNAVRELIGSLTHDAVAFMPAAMEADHVVKIIGEAPWVSRIAEIKANAAINLEAERQVAQLTDELQGLVRAIRIRDQTIQEAGVKIELMERRNETVKKHAETISDLEAELGKAREQKRDYEEAMEQLQSDLDSLEQDYTKLKASAPAPSDRPTNDIQPAGVETIAPDNNLETSHLLEQIESLRGAVKFLRSENNYLKGQDLLKELQSLPPLPDLVHSEDSSSDGSSEADSDEFPSTPLSVRSLSTVTKVLYRDVLAFSSSPRVVDLSIVNDPKNRGGWISQKKTPHHQLWERTLEAQRLKERLNGLRERTSNMAVARSRSVANGLFGLR